MERTDIHTPVGLLLVERPELVALFEGLGIDYFSSGKLPLDKACRAAGVDPELVLAQLAAQAGAPPADRDDPADLTLAELADHIEATHHAYLRRALPRLSEMLEKVSQVHGATYPWLADFNAVFSDFTHELKLHMLKEEQILFPMIRQLETAQSLPNFHCGSVDNPIAAMEYEHDSAGVALSRLRELSDNFSPPKDACSTFKALLEGLAELEVDLHQHIHKENNLLFVRACLAEGRLRSD